MKNKHVIICVLGSSVAFLGVCLYVIWKRRGNEEKKPVAEMYGESNRPMEFQWPMVCHNPHPHCSLSTDTETDKIRRKKPCPRRLNYHVDCGDGLLSGEEIKVRTVGRVTSGSNPDILSQEGTGRHNHAVPADQSETSLSSMTSYDDDSSISSGEKPNYLSNDSTSTSETSIAGVFEESTYKRMQENIHPPDELDNLTGSPVVADFLTDTRCHDLNREDSVARTPSNVVVEYRGDVTPVNVNKNIQNVSETYSNIVPPLQPNTGTIVSTNT